MRVDESQSWFWTPEWQEKERAADADFAAGRFRTHESTEAFLEALDDEPFAPAATPPQAS
jgi:hypothetical protein